MFYIELFITFSAVYHLALDGKSLTPHLIDQCVLRCLAVQSNIATTKKLDCQKLMFHLVHTHKEGFVAETS